MELFWLVVTFGLGGLTGFVVFALMQMSQASGVERSEANRRDTAYPAPQPFDDEGDTASPRV